MGGRSFPERVADLFRNHWPIFFGIRNDMTSASREPSQMSDVTRTHVEAILNSLKEEADGDA
jgi:hypothetical protein